MKKSRFRYLIFDIEDVLLQRFRIIFFMKRIAFVFAVLLCVTAFVSCNKSGVYNPKDKLSKVWFEKESVVIIDSVEHKNPSVEKYLREEWLWDGNFLNSRTVFRSNHDVWYNYKYEYNKKNLIVGITTAEKGTRIRFIYDDDKRLLKEIKYYTELFPDAEQPYRKLELTYDGKKLMSIKETINTQRYPRNAYNEISLLPYLVSEEMAASIEANMISEKVEADQTTNEYAFEWEKKNITNVKITTKKGENTTETTISYTYDDNRNPQMARVMGLVEDATVSPLICSHNNVVSCTYEGQNMTYTEECQYTYDKKTPVEKIVTREEKTSVSTSKITEKWSYEYVE